jgi:hypothetical protein
MAAGGANSLTFRQLRTGTALLKGWAVTAWFYDSRIL